jgi:hypothetical protein
MTTIPPSTFSSIRAFWRICIESFLILRL